MGWVFFRVLVLLLRHGGVLGSYDLFRLSEIRHHESRVLLVSLRRYGGRIGHGIESLRHRYQIDICWRKSIRSSIDIHLCRCRRWLHSRSDELFQQGIEHIFSVHVSQAKNLNTYLPRSFFVIDIEIDIDIDIILQRKPNLLRNIHDRGPHGFIRPISRIQHDQWHWHNVSSLRLSHHILGSLFT